MDEGRTGRLGHESYAPHVVPSELPEATFQLVMLLERALQQVWRRTTRSKEELKKTVTKLHRQFAHPGREPFIKLLKESGVMNKDTMQYVNELYTNCDICKQTARTPSACPWLVILTR